MANRNSKYNYRVWAKAARQRMASDPGVNFVRAFADARAEIGPR